MILMAASLELYSEKMDSVKFVSNNENLLAFEIKRNVELVGHVRIVNEASAMDENTSELKQ